MGAKFWNVEFICRRTKKISGYSKKKKNKKKKKTTIIKITYNGIDHS